MANSERLTKLKKRIKFLEDNMLPQSRPTGNYTVRERDQIKGYLLLAHAEIEAYFEDIVKARVQKSHRKFQASNIIDGCLSSLLAFPGNELNYEANQPHALDIAHRIGRAVGHFNSLVNKNHGIKKVNIHALVLPVGIPFSELDTTWLAVMDNFGTLRGEIAHNALAVQNLVDRNTLVNTINTQIIPEITRLDSILKRL